MEAAGQPGSYPGVVLFHKEIVEAAGQPGSYPGMVKFHMKVFRRCRPAR